MHLYAIARQFLRVCTHMYFVDIRSSGRRNLPASGPVILAANHPSSILDGILLTTQLTRPINYLAKSELFRLPVLASLYRQLGAIPVYRSGFSRQAGQRNQEAFEKVYGVLEKGGCVGIFPEGQNSPRHRVADLRPGTARMALGAEARNEYGLGLVIVPTGIHFENRELFLSAVQLRFGRPIRVADYADLHRADPEAAVRELTRDIERRLRRQALHIEDHRLTSLLEDLGTLYARELERAGESGSADGEEQPPGPVSRLRKRLLAWFRPATVDPRRLESGLEGQHRINTILTGLSELRPKAIDALRVRVDRYKAHLNQINLRADLRENLDEPIRERLIQLRMTLYAIFMAPVALWGLVHNVVPYLFTRLSAGLFRDEAIRGFAYFGIGVLAFGFAYGAFGVWLWRFTEVSLPWTLAWIASLPPAGFACLRYRGAVLRYRDRVLVRTFFRTQGDVTEALAAERRQIIAWIQALDRRYALSDPD